MNSKIEQRFSQMFIEKSKEIGADRGSMSEIEMSKDEMSLRFNYIQEFLFGKKDEEYKYIGKIKTDLDGNIIEESCEEI